jgi:hypothetical protein
MADHNPCVLKELSMFKSKYTIFKNELYKANQAWLPGFVSLIPRRTKNGFQGHLHTIEKILKRVLGCQNSDETPLI